MRAADPEPAVFGYLDTCLISGLAERDLRPAELEALGSILRGYKRGELGLVTSAVTKLELARMSDAKRAGHEDIYSLIEDVPAVPEFSHGVGLLAFEPVYDDPDFEYLEQVLPDEDDARHLFQAIRNNVDYFVTDDERTIVSRRSAVESHYPIRVRLPSELVAELGL